MSVGSLWMNIDYVFFCHDDHGESEDALRRFCEMYGSDWIFYRNLDEVREMHAEYARASWSALVIEHPCDAWERPPATFAFCAEDVKHWYEERAAIAFQSAWRARQCRVGMEALWMEYCAPGGRYYQSLVRKYFG